MLNKILERHMAKAHALQYEVFAFIDNIDEKKKRS